MIVYHCPKCGLSFQRGSSNDGHYDHRCLKCHQLMQWDEAPFSADPHSCGHGLRHLPESQIPLVCKPD